MPLRRMTARRSGERTGACGKYATGARSRGITGEEQDVMRKGNTYGLQIGLQEKASRYAQGVTLMVMMQYQPAGLRILAVK